MSEAIISRRGWGEGGKPELRTETITGNTNRTVPNYRSDSVSVRIFGGGGRGNGGRGYQFGGGGTFCGNGGAGGMWDGGDGGGEQIPSSYYGDGYSKGGNGGTYGGGGTGGAYISNNPLNSKQEEGVIALSSFERRVL